MSKTEKKVRAGRANKYEDLLSEKRDVYMDSEEEEEAVPEKIDKSAALFDRDERAPHAAQFGKKLFFGDAESEVDEASDEDVKSHESESEEEEEEEEEEEIFTDWDLAALQQSRRGEIVDDPNKIARLWESEFQITAFQNLEKSAQYHYFVITFGPVNKNRQSHGALERRTLYSPGFYLQPGEYRPLVVPFIVWPFKVFPLPYAELPNYAVDIDMWKVSSRQFNERYASFSITLREAMDNPPETNFMLRRSLKGKKKTYEAHRLRVWFSLSQVMVFDMYFETWWFNPDSRLPPEILSFPKALKFIVPKGHHLGWDTQWTNWSTDNSYAESFLFSFKGTKTHLELSYFIVEIYAQSDTKWYSRPAHIGSCIMSLKSVQTYPFFRGSVKKLSRDVNRFVQGELIGSIRCLPRSAGLNYYEDSNAKTVEQPLAGAAIVTQLDRKEQYLVVRLLKCENLSASNTDTGTSDPTVKIKWDGMINQAAVRRGTLRPAWNQNYFFPVRLLDRRERFPPFSETCLPIDIASKGHIVFEVWNQDESTSDFLGGCQIHVSKITSDGIVELRSLAENSGDDDNARMPDGRPAKFKLDFAAGEDDDDASDYEVGMWEQGDLHQGTVASFNKKMETPVFKAFGMELTGGVHMRRVANEAKAMIYFEAYFIPPFPHHFEIPVPIPVREEQDMLKQTKKRWERDFNKWQFVYQDWFPQCPKNRRFIATAEHPHTGNIIPLPSFITPIPLPEQIQADGELLHWISNITFQCTPTEIRTGEIGRWSSPNYFLMSRKGGINDHAALLCSCLIGKGYDAFVCKGTMKNGTQDHCWVMTRHTDGYVIFWESTNKKRYHLPSRWLYDHVPPPFVISGEHSYHDEEYFQGGFLEEWFQYAKATTVLEATDQSGALDIEIWGEDVVPDIRVSETEFQLEGELSAQESEIKKGQVKKIDHARIRDMMKNELERLPISPRKFLLDLESTLCYIPYDSIEVVFNNEQVYANMQNHHPAVITYDLEDEWKWRQFLEEPPEPIDKDIFLAPSARQQACEALSNELEEEICESIRLTRNRRGWETLFDNNEILTERLQKYLDLLEYRLHLDPDFDPGPPDFHVGWSAFSEFESLESDRVVGKDWYSNLDPTQNVEFAQPLPRDINQQMAGLSTPQALVPEFQEVEAYGAAPPGSDKEDLKVQAKEPGPRSNVQESDGEVRIETQVASPTSVKKEGNENSEWQVLNDGVGVKSSIVESSSDDSSSDDEEQETLDQECLRRNISIVGSSELSQDNTPKFKFVTSARKTFMKTEQESSGKTNRDRLKFAKRKVNEALNVENQKPKVESNEFIIMIDGPEVEDLTIDIKPPNVDTQSTAQKDEAWDSFQRIFDEADVSAMTTSQTSSSACLRHLKYKNTAQHQAPKKEAGKSAMETKKPKVPHALLRKGEAPPMPEGLKKYYEDQATAYYDEHGYGYGEEGHGYGEEGYDEEGYGYDQYGYDQYGYDQQYGAYGQPGYDGQPAPMAYEETDQFKSAQALKRKAEQLDISDLYSREKRPSLTADQARFDGGLDLASLGLSTTPKLRKPAVIIPTEGKGSLEKDDYVTAEQQLEGVDYEMAEEEAELMYLIPDGPVEPPMLFDRNAELPLAKYQMDQTARWRYYYRMESLYYQWQRVKFPVRGNHTFCGFPVHFSSTDFTEVRSFILQAKRFKKIVTLPINGIVYVVRCKVYPLTAGVVSFWLFLGCEVPWTSVKESERRMQRKTKKRGA